MRGGAALLSLLFVSGPVAAQVAPFDMAPERAILPDRPMTEPVSSRPRQVERPEARRHILTLTEPRLVGEEAVRSWSVYLTAAESDEATLHLGFASSVFVAPEASRLHLTINGTPVVDTAIRGADEPAAHLAPLPEGVLRPGPNTFTIRARQRHRTDCSIGSTYDLWTELDPARTYLTFADPAASTPREPIDALATGTDASGATRIAIVSPEAGDPAVTGEAMRLAQVLASAIGAARPVVTLAEAIDQAFEEADLKVAFGSASALAALLELPVLESEPRFVARPGLGSVLVVDVGAIDRLAESLAPEVADAGIVRTAAWQLPDAPLAEGARRLDFAMLGVPSQEFSGRLASFGFQIALPADFYAQGYGEAELVLDGAYAPEVMTGSRIDVYVNDNLASTMPVGARGGGIFRNLPLGVTMRHFRPGVNAVRIDAVMETEADANCAMGAPAAGAPRLALFDTSSFVVPRFARLGQLPNLAATTTRSFPYADEGGASGEPVALVLGDASGATRSAAATLLAKLAQSSGRVIPVEITEAGATARNAIFVGPVNRLPDAVLNTVDLNPAARNDWSGISLEANDDASREGVTATAPMSVDGWRASNARGSWLQPVNAASDFLRANAPRLPWLGERDTTYRPDSDTTLVLAQGAVPDGAWMVLTAPTPQLLSEGASILVGQKVWSGISGQLVALRKGSERPFVVPAAGTVAVPTQPWSFVNARLVTANWMSGNVVAFSAALSIACLLLGITTRTILTSLGRRR